MSEAAATTRLAYVLHPVSLHYHPQPTLITLPSQGPTQPLQPPQRALLPLWLALLLKRQRRANIVPPPWLHPSSLEYILKYETEISRESFSPGPPLPPAPSGVEASSPPFLLSATADSPEKALPYHWLEMGEILLDAASDDLIEPDTVRRFLRDLREARLSKIRAGVAVLDASGVVSLRGVGGMEVCESRGFIVGVIDGLRYGVMKTILIFRCLENVLMIRLGKLGLRKNRLDGNGRRRKQMPERLMRMTWRSNAITKHVVLWAAVLCFRTDRDNAGISCCWDEH